MVKRRQVLAVFPALLVLTLFLASACQPSVSAAEIQYHLEKQWVKIWVNMDGTIDLQYTIRVVCDQGRISYVTFDQPVGDFTIGEASDAEGHALRIEDATQGSDYKVKVFLYEPLTTGQSAEVSATTNVGQMIWKDEMNPGNVGLQFIPTSWSVGISDLRVLVVLPAGVSKEQIRVTPDWDNAYTDPNENGRLVVYWERKDVAPNTRFQVGVSFPATSIERYETTTQTSISPGLVSGIVAFLVILVFIAIVVVVVLLTHVLRRRYLDPKMQMETLGIKRGLTAVEAAYLLDASAAKVIVMILYSLLLKRAVWVNSTEPSLNLQIMERFKDAASRSPETGLRYYEEDFLRAIKPDGTLDEKELAEAFMRVRSAVENTLRGYCRADTIAFYKKTVQEAWEQVEKAGTPDLASKIFDENLLWLTLDDNFREKSETTFKAFDFQPLPFWWWYWYGYTQYNPNPTYNPSTSQGQPPPKISGVEFANTIATSLEKTAGNFVANIEKFTNSILPAPPPKEVSRQPVRHGANCACACVSCACVCACVSCACACASGGGVG
jgi:hypothetical protein